MMRSSTTTARLRHRQKVGLETQKGLATVELALVTPFLLVMMLVAGEFTRVFIEYNALEKGVRDAARLLADDSFDGTRQFEITEGDIDRARNLVEFGNINGSGDPLFERPVVVTITQVNLGAAPVTREHVEVTATYTRPPGMGIPGLGFLPNNVNLGFTLTASSSMRGL